MTPAFWQGRRVFLTGHTGFKGGWLALWLRELGAEVTGYALAPPTVPNFFEAARIDTTLNSVIGDIRDFAAVQRAMREARPQILFHLAAQPLVAEGYADPAGTYGTNVMGTVAVLEAARSCPDLESVVVVTTDKCYENRETLHCYRESDPLGGKDPYSSSKACAELVTAAYRQSFFGAPDAPQLASARAGNVIGGGDWAEHRLLPDLLRAFGNGETATLRNPTAVRPWQHVLEPLYGYLRLAEQLCSDASLARAWNFGPELPDCVDAATVADLTAQHWPQAAAWQSRASDFPHEAQLLRLDNSAAKQNLKWRPRWPLTEAIHHTVDWHQNWLHGADMQACSRQQIRQYAQTPHTQ